VAGVEPHEQTATVAVIDRNGMGVGSPQPETSAAEVPLMVTRSITPRARARDDGNEVEAGLNAFPITFEGRIHLAGNLIMRPDDHRYLTLSHWRRSPVGEVSRA